MSGQPGPAAAPAGLEPADVDPLRLFVDLSDAVLRMTKLLGELALERFDVPLKGVYLLQRIEAAGSLRVTDLVDEVYVSASAASRTLDRLFDRGLIQRQASDVDGRATAVSLTPAGRRLARRARRAMSDSVQAALLVDLSPTDLRRLTDLVTRLADPLRPYPRRSARSGAARPGPTPARR